MIRLGYLESKKIQFLNLLRQGYHHEGQSQKPPLLHIMGHLVSLRNLYQLLLVFLQITVLKDCNTRLLEFVLWQLVALTEIRIELLGGKVGDTQRVFNAAKRLTLNHTDRYEHHH